MSASVLITPAALDARAGDDLVLIDTRNPAAYAAGHLPGAVNIHDIFTYLATSTPEGIAAMRAHFSAAFAAAGLSGRQTAVLYEQSMNTGFGQSCRGYVLLRDLGYPSVQILHGGYDAWLGAGLPVSTEPAQPVAALFPPPPPGPSLLVGLEEMKRVLADASVIKLDVRDVDEWIGESSSPYGRDFCPRKGRLPGARWIEWYRMMKPSAQGPVMKAPAEVLAECASVGITPETPVVVYCFKGARASNTLVALANAGIKDVRLYFGSWNEWSRDPSLPIEEGLLHAELAQAAE